MSEDPVLRARSLRRVYGGGKARAAEVVALDDVNLDIVAGELLALVGPSGSGKSTLMHLMGCLDEPTAGQLHITGIDVAGLTDRELSGLRANLIGFVFQQFFLSPVQTALDNVADGLLYTGVDRDERRDRAAAALERVGLADRLDHRPAELSGGQRQRVGVARALALEPQIIVADEPVSALDVSVQAQVMNLLLDLQQNLDLSYVFISHDLAVVRQIADRVAVMYSGRIAETGAAAGLYSAPAHPYTMALLSAAPIPDPQVQAERERIELPGDPPDSINPPSGCRFRTRCWKAQSICAEQEPQLRVIAPDHSVACHFPEIAE